MTEIPHAGGTELPAAARRVAEAAAALGLAIAVIEMPGSTRTAADAAAAVGCGVGQIVKSLVFRGRESGRPYLLLVSGANRVDEAGVAGRMGEALDRPDATFVRDATGYAIGGIPPFGHATAMKTFFDADLLAFEVIWAAAGTPKTVFRTEPRALLRATGATVIAVS